MDTQVQTQPTPILVTLTGGTASGKTFLLNYIRETAKLPCLVSTTTRKPRAGEVEGVDYFFISDERSREIEAANGFAELAIYNGTRYGVTKEEFFSKLNKGLAFLIVEPSGIDHYVQPAKNVGAKHLKYFIHTPQDLVLQRFKLRMVADIDKHFLNWLAAAEYGDTDAYDPTSIPLSYVMRLQNILTFESSWYQMAPWDRVLMGIDRPEDNVKIILSDVKKLQEMTAEIERDQEKLRYAAYETAQRHRLGNDAEGVYY